MTKVTFHSSRAREGFRGFTAEGHAGATGEREYDLVCCAVSVLTVTAANALEKVARVRPVEAEGDGLVTCFLPEGMSDGAWKTAQIIFRTMECGLESIAAEYPEQLRIERK